MPAVSIVVPAYNERARLKATLPQLVEAANGRDVEIILVDDGSTDDTAAVAEAHLDARSHGRVLRLAKNSGKGAAVRAGVLEASGDAVVYMDADMATDLDGLKPLLAALEAADVAVGSRGVDGARVIGGTASRAFMAQTWNGMVRTMTELRLRDTQCGFKAFRAPAARTLFTCARVNRFAFDVEILALAQRLGMTIVEVPVTWSAVNGSSVRPVLDSANMMWDLVRMRMRMRTASGRLGSREPRSAT